MAGGRRSRAGSVNEDLTSIASPTTMSENITCSIKNCSNSTSTQILCCPSCSSKAHKECLGMDKKFFDTLKSNKHSWINWQCKNCTLKLTSPKQPADIQQLIHEIRTELKAELCKEIKKEMSELNDLILKSLSPTKLTEQISSNETGTFSQVRANDSANEKPNTTHKILLEPKDKENESNFSEEKWNEIVKQTIAPKLKNIPVSKALRSKAGKGVLLFPTAESRDIALSSLKDDCTLEAEDEEIKKLYPKVKISWIPKTYFEKLDKESLKDSILEKNPTIKNLVNEEKKALEIVFINDERDNNFSHAVVKVDPAIKKAINLLGDKIYIGLSACRVNVRYHLLQCYKCQQFGHKKGSDKCILVNTNKEVCLYCSLNHASKNCPIKSTDISKWKCNNCCNSKDPLLRSNCVGHTTTSRNCPVLQQALKNTMNRTLGTTYRSDVPKNWIST